MSRVKRNPEPKHLSTASAYGSVPESRKIWVDRGGGRKVRAP